MALAGVAALVTEKWPDFGPQEVRQKIVAGARNVWQATSIETDEWSEISVDPVTTKSRLAVNPEREY
jgi:hypothetical protein